jgi:hypothetical protein
MHFECLYFVDTKTANFIYAYILYLVMLSDSALKAAMLSVILLSVTMLCCYIDNAVIMLSLVLLSNIAMLSVL